MRMVIFMQIVCVILAMVAMGQSLKTNATKFDKVAYIVTSFLYLIFCYALQGVR